MPTTIRSVLRRYGGATLAVALAIWVRVLLDPLLGDQYPFITLFFAVLFAAWQGGFGPALLATLVGALSSAYFLIPPRGQFTIEHPHEQAGVAIYLAVSTGIALLGAAMRSARLRAEASAREAAARQEALQQEIAGRRRDEEQRAWLAAIVEGTDDAIVGKTLDGVITSWNAGAERLYGYAAAEVVGRPAAVLLSPDRPDEVGRLLDQVRRGERVDHFETVRRRKDGTLVTVSLTESPVRDVAGAVVGISVIGRDITERKRAEAELRRSEERYRSFVTASAQVVWITNAAGELVDDMPEWQAYTGQSREEARGLGWMAAIRPEDRGRVSDAWQRAIATHTPYEVEYLLRTHDGSWRHIQARGVPVLEPDGRIREWVGTCIDVTERRCAEEALRQRSEELAEANRDLAQKNQENEMFVYSVSHDLRSPLVNLQGFSKELDRGCQALATLFADESLPPTARQQGAALLNGKMAKSLGFIQTAVLRLSGIIDALLRLSRAGRVEYRPERVDVARLAQQVVDAAQGTVGERGVRVTVGELPPAFGDRTALAQVFANLLGNALTYLDPARPGAIELGCLPRGTDGVPEGFRIYYVKDNGLGIAEAHRGKIFQVFQRAHPHVGKGEGMGLAIVSRVIERHRGRVWVESEVGKGSTFFVTLPAATDEGNSHP